MAMPTARNAERPATDLTVSVVRVLNAAGGTAGTGFLVSDRLLVTCAHVLGEPSGAPVSVEFVGSVIRTAMHDEEVRCEGTDIAFLRLDTAPPEQVRRLPLGVTRGVSGHRVKTYGFPANAPSGGHYGYAVAGDLINDGLLQLTECTEVTRGFSGGPVVDELTGLVAGMVTSVPRPDSLGRGRSTAYAVPAETLRELCPSLRISPTCPYAGLRPYAAADAEVFFGRDRAIGSVLSSLRRDPGFLVLLGPSGSGKSSLVQAGVLPAFERGALPGSDRWAPVTVTPGTDPYGALAAAGLGDLPASAGSWLEAHPGHDRLVLVLDQFEEVLVQAPPETRLGLLRQLADVVNHDLDLPVTVIIVMRDDFYSTLAAAAPALLERGLVNVPATLERAELTAIITSPAASAGVTLELGLAERIADDAARVSPVPAEAPVTVLPLLSSALAELWDRQQDGRLTHQAYERIGGVAGWLGRWCDRAYQAACEALPADEHGAARRVLTSLARPGDASHGVPPTRQRRSTRDMDPRTAAIVRVLADQRLIVTAHEAEIGDAFAELAHESLIHEWAALRRWLDEDAGFLTWRRDLETRHAQWQQAPETQQLLQGTALDAALKWLENRRAELAADLVTFITASDSAAQRQRSKDRRRATLFGTLAIGAALTTVAAAVLFGIARHETGQARSQAARANQQARLAQANQFAGEAVGLAGSQPDVAALLALQSIATAPNQTEWGSLGKVLEQRTELSRVAYGSGAQMNAVAFSPDGALLASGDQDGQIRVWNIRTGALVGSAFGPSSPLQAISALAFSPDGKVLATMGFGSGLQLWSVATHVLIGKPLMTDTSGLIDSVAFSPDGRVLLAAAGSQVTMWDTRTWRTALHLSAAQVPGNITGAALSPSGSTVAISTDVGYIQQWNRASGRPSGTAIVPGGADRVAYSPDGKDLAVPSYAGNTYLLNATSGKVLQTLPGSTWPVNTVAFSPDGKTLVTGDGQGVLRIWNPATGQQTGTELLGHTGAVQDIAFAPGGSALASASDDGTVRLWDFTVRQALGAELTRQAGSVNDIAFSPDGKLVAAGGDDQTARLWDVATGAQVRVISPEQTLTNVPVGMTPYPIDEVAFSPDGRLLATMGNQVRLWNVQSGAQVAGVLSLPPGDAQGGGAFSPDGRLLVTAGDAGVRLWNVATHRPDGGTLPHGSANSQLYRVVFSPDGRLLAASTKDGIILWDVATRHYIGTIHHRYLLNIAFTPDGKRIAAVAMVFGPDATQLGDDIDFFDVGTRQQTGSPIATGSEDISRIAFSPDGGLLATGDQHGSIELWDLATGQEFGIPLKLHTDVIVGLAFNAQGSMLGSASEDGTARLWMMPRYWVWEACQIAGRNLSRAEWDQYVGSDVPYVRTCPLYPTGNGAPVRAPAATYPQVP
jgi:WD40 repeat protein